MITKRQVNILWFVLILVVVTLISIILNSTINKAQEHNIFSDNLKSIFGFFEAFSILSLMIGFSVSVSLFFRKERVKSLSMLSKKVFSKKIMQLLGLEDYKIIDVKKQIRALNLINIENTNEQELLRMEYIRGEMASKSIKNMFSLNIEKEKKLEEISEEEKNKLKEEIILRVKEIDTKSKNTLDSLNKKNILNQKDISLSLTEQSLGFCLSVFFTIYSKIISEKKYFNDGVYLFHILQNLQNSELIKENNVSFIRLEKDLVLLKEYYYLTREDKASTFKKDKLNFFIFREKRRIIKIIKDDELLELLISDKNDTNVFIEQRLNLVIKDNELLKSIVSNNEEGTTQEEVENQMTILKEYLENKIIELKKDLDKKEILIKELTKN